MTTLAGAGGPAGDSAELERARRRARFVLVGGAALGATAMVIASTIAAIAAVEMLGDRVLAGAAGAALVVGVAIGTSALAAVISRRGQRFGLSLGYGMGAAGAVLAAWAFAAGAFVPLLLALVLVGFANSSAALSRYASAEMASDAEQASAISIVVWASTVGAVVGPALVPLAATLADGLAVEQLLGPLVATAVLAGVAAILLSWLLRPDVRELTIAHHQDHVDPGPSLPLRSILRRPTISLALTAMVVGQVVMVVIMSMTPVHMTDNGHDLRAVGVVISAHTLGMFALSPLSGRIADRAGYLPAIGGSIVLLAIASVLSSIAPVEGGFLLLLALFLLGYGWNLGFVAGSALLTSGLAAHERTRTQGVTDTLVWGSSAVANLAGGLLLATLGFAALGVVGLLLLGIAAVALVRLRGAISPAVAPG